MSRKVCNSTSTEWGIHAHHHDILATIRPCHTTNQNGMKRAGHVDSSSILRMYCKTVNLSVTQTMQKSRMIHYS